jgi:hypothetical protein
MVLLIGLSILVSARPAMASEALAMIATNAGKVVLMEENGKRFFSLNGQTIFEGTELLSVHQTFRSRTYEAILVKDYTGFIACPIRYTFLVFYRNGQYGYSPPFGRCADNPEIRSEKGTITIRFKAFGSQPPSAFTFDGRNLVKSE